MFFRKQMYKLIEHFHEHFSLLGRIAQGIVLFRTRIKHGTTFGSFVVDDLNYRNTLARYSGLLIAAFVCIYSTLGLQNAIVVILFFSGGYSSNTWPCSCYWSTYTSIHPIPICGTLKKWIENCIFQPNQIHLCFILRNE